MGQALGSGQGEVGSALPLTAETTDARLDAPPTPVTARGRPGLVQIFPRSASEVSQVWRVGGSAVVGRGAGADILIADQRVSRAHARLDNAPTGLRVRDLGSRHGSWLSGSQLSADGALAAFDSVVRFGNSLFLVVNDVERYRVAPRRIAGSALGLPTDVIAGPVLSEVWDRATRVAGLSAPVLLLGESGSGKESVARLIHRSMGRPCPFVGINLAAIPDALFESELFGHERGAFTGAVKSRAGAFREAAGGVLFLDEVGDLRVDLQAKLLRAVDLQAVRPLGASHDVPSAVRLVAATSVDLRRACEEGRFRSDLYYRLQGVVLQVPPLRERRDDILLLALDIIEKEAPRLRLSANAAEQLALAACDGNARALRSAVLHGLGSALAGDASEIRAEHLPPLERCDRDRTLTETEVRAAMTRAAGVASQAALLLGVSRTTFYNMCKRFGISASSLRSG
jgi:transcriptional regulator of acetoin/glycerol metabolism